MKSYCEIYFFAFLKTFTLQKNYLFDNATTPWPPLRPPQNLVLFEQLLGNIIDMSNPDNLHPGH